MMDAIEMNWSSDSDADLASPHGYDVRPVGVEDQHIGVPGLRMMGSYDVRPVWSKESSEPDGHSMPKYSEVSSTPFYEGEGKRPRRRRNRFHAYMALFACIILALGVILLSLRLAASDDVIAKATIAPTEASPSDPDDPVEPVDLDNSGSLDIVQTDRLTQMMDLLVHHQASHRTSLEDPQSPQHVAVQWLSFQLAVEIPDDIESEKGYNFISLYVLALLYFATDGPRWIFDSRFLQSTEKCLWYNVVVFPDDSRKYSGVGCDENGNIAALVLDDNNIAGQLPTELGLLWSLKLLYLDMNPRLEGTIPDTFEHLTEIVDLHLSSNGLVGTFPSYIGKLTNLVSLDVSFNALQGTVPSTLGDLEKLEFLALDRNLLEGDLNEIFSGDGLNALRALYLENNLFGGELEETFLDNMAELVLLDLSDNQLSGAIPAKLFTLPTLMTLDVHDNSFSSLPDPFPINEVLNMLTVQKNSLEGSMPDSIRNLQNLTHLDLSQNALTGDIPVGISELSQLTYLFLAVNDLSEGPIPDSFEKLELLEELSLKSTNRTGPIPHFIGDTLKNLLLLDLDDNKLVGEIPSNLGSLQQMEWLLLNRNQLEGTIPEEFANMENLRLFFMEGNNITSGLNNVCSIVPKSSNSNRTTIVADCSLCDTVPASCCEECCSQDNPCSERSHVPDMDPFWQVGYQRIFYVFSKEDWFS